MRAASRTRAPAQRLTPPSPPRPRPFPLPLALPRSSPLVLALLLVACGGTSDPAFARGVDEGALAARSGRHREAADRYTRAANVARAPRDAGHARYLAAMELVRAGDVAEGASRLRTIAALPESEAPAIAAELALADLALAHGDEAEGVAALERFVRSHAASGLARPALMRLLAVKDAAGDPAAIAWLRSLEPALGASELGETIAYQVALRLQRAGDTARARDAFVDVATRWPYPRGALFDDALYRASELDEALGRPAAAAADLERMLRERETATLVGSYERPRYDAAMLRLARLYRDRLGDRARAAATFRRLVDELRTSTLRDDALWEEAALVGEGRGGPARCARLATLLTELPDSRYVPCAIEDCALPRPNGSRAPATCHAYLRRAPSEETR